MKSKKKVSAACLKTLQKYSLLIARPDIPDSRKDYPAHEPSTNEIHYKYSDENGVGLLCKTGYYPNHIITRDISKLTCKYCMTVILLEAHEENQEVWLH